MKHKRWLLKYDKGVPRSIHYPDWTVDRLLEISSRNYPERTALIQEATRYSYRQLWLAVLRLSDALLSMGLKKGQPVALIFPNCAHFVLGYFAILRAGGIVVAINPQYKSDEIREQLIRTHTTWVICSEQAAQIVKTLGGDCALSWIIVSDPESLIKVNEEPIEPIENIKPEEIVIPMQTLLSRKWAEKKRISRQAFPAVLQFSGGTTGTPKAAVGLHKNLVANTIQFRKWLVGLRMGREVVLAAIPLFHVYGIVIAMSLGIYLGATIVLVQNPRDTLAIVSCIERYKVTLFPGVPNMYFAINNLPTGVLKKHSLRSIKACISGSAPLSATIKNAFERLTGGKLMEGYGLSEAPTATHCNPMFGENRTGSIGLPLPDVDCKIVDLSSGGKEMPVGEAGEMIIRGPQVMKGYYRDHGETKLALRKRWLYTGDIARCDEDGYFYLIGRKKELIKVGGFQVWPSEIEEVIQRHVGVKEVAVAGVTDDKGSEMVIAWIVRQPGEQQVTTDVLNDLCRKSLTDYKVPRKWIFVDSLPRSTVGKILKRQLIAEYENKSGSR